MGSELKQVSGDMFGIHCVCRYEGSSFKKWDSRDKENPGRQKTNRQVVHRFKWPTENGDQFVHVAEWLNDDKVNTLKDCKIVWIEGAFYDLSLNDLKTEGGVLQGRVNPALSQQVEVSA
jgi:hypothetical protein